MDKKSNDVVFRRIRGRIVPIRNSNHSKRTKRNSDSDIPRQAKKVNSALLKLPSSVATGSAFGTGLFFGLKAFEGDMRSKKARITRILHKNSHNAIKPVRPVVMSLAKWAEFENKTLRYKSATARAAKLSRSLGDLNKKIKLVNASKGKLGILFGAAVGISQYLGRSDNDKP